MTLPDFCRTLPHATEDIKWDDDLVFSVGGKMFAAFEQRESGFARYSFKCSEAQFEALIGRPGIIPAPYLARAHWVSVTEPDAMPPEEAQEALENAYRLVFARLPKKTQRELADGPAVG
jgi:predicted DNA-binding protein (MmcQ/YjbR family)